MTTHRTTSVASTLTAIAVVICVVATAALIAFPGNPAVWQWSAWTLTAGLVGVLALVPLLAFQLVTRRAARTMRHVASLAAGLVCLAIVIVGSL